MKEIILLLVALFFYQMLKAQTWSEWFRQNHTQLLYLQDQIAALQANQLTQQSGYAVCEDGLVNIDTVTEADFEEHDAHVDYLNAPSQNVLSDPRIAEINGLCERISHMANAMESLGQLGSPVQKTLGQNLKKSYDDSVYSVAMRLADILAANKLQMTDAQREKSIFNLRQEVRAIYKHCTMALNEFTQ